MEEAVVLHSISSVVSSAVDLQRSTERIADLITEIPGVVGIEFPGVSATASEPGRGAVIAVANAPIAAGDRHWGDLRIRFDIQKLRFASPLRFARFVGQQLGLLIATAEATVRNEARRRELNALKEDLETRKIFQRAGGIVAREQGVSEAEAAARLSAQARRAGRPVRHIAEGLILATRPGSQAMARAAGRRSA